MSNVAHNVLTGLDLHASKIAISTGAPTSTPTYIGQSYWDQTGKKLYVAIGTTSAVDWTTTTASSLAIANTSTVTLAFVGLGGNLTADVILSSISIPSSQITDFAAGVAANTTVAANTAARHSALAVWTSGGLTPSSSSRGLEMDSATQIIRLTQDLSASGSPTFNSLTSTTTIFANQGTLVLKELTANGTDSVTLRASANMSASYTITLPSSAPSSGTALTFDGSNYVWATPSGGNTGTETIANNISSATSLSSLLFNGTVTRAAVIQYSVYRSTSLNEVAENGTIRIVYKSTAGTWNIAQEYTGESSEVVFTITSAGQIKYTSSNISGTGHTGTMKFSYLTTDV